MRVFLRRCLVCNKDSRCQKGSQLANLNPFIDEAGLLRVGGRLNKAVNALGCANSSERTSHFNPHYTTLSRICQASGEAVHRGRHQEQLILDSRSKARCIVGPAQVRQV